MGVRLAEALQRLPCGPEIELIGLEASTPARAGIGGELLTPETLPPEIADVLADQLDPVVAVAEYLKLDTGDVARLVSVEGDDGLRVAWSDDGGVLSRRVDSSCSALEAAAVAGFFESLPLAQPEDMPVGLRTVSLGDEYAALKDGSAWVRGLDGSRSWTSWYSTPSGDLWSLSLLDLGSEEGAAEVWAGLYGNRMGRAEASAANRRAQATGGEALYRTEVRGRPAWYVDKYRRAGHKELNFAEGPYVVALGSWVLDSDPLRMQDLVARAEGLPTLGGLH